MKRWLPNPLLSAALLIVWLTLNQSVAAAHVLLGTALAVATPLLVRRLRPTPVRIRRPLVIARLTVYSLREIIVSAFNVSRIILGVHRRLPHSRFIRIPLDLRDPHGLAVLSCLVNATPGTVWVEILTDAHDLALHVFDLHDPEWWVETIKTRYERPLMEIFEQVPPCSS